MAYEKIAWKNREVEKPRTYTKVDNSDGTITLTPAEGNIIEPGTPIIADNMNHIEQGIEDVDQAIDTHISDSEKHIPYATASGTNTYTVSISGISSLAEGLSIKVKFTNANTGTATLNVNSLGTKSIVKSNGNALSSGNIKAGQICHLVYTGSNFQLLGEGGEYGTAQAGDVLSGKTIGTESGIITGTMPNNGAINNTITTQNGQIVVPTGYHSGSGIVRAQFANLIAGNVKKDINIGGIVGNYTGEHRDLIAEKSTSGLFDASSIIIPQSQNYLISKRFVLKLGGTINVVPLIPNYGIRYWKWRYYKDGNLSSWITEDNSDNGKLSIHVDYNTILEFEIFTDQSDLRYEGIFINGYLNYPQLVDLISI